MERLLDIIHPHTPPLLLVKVNGSSWLSNLFCFELTVLCQTALEPTTLLGQAICWRIAKQQYDGVISQTIPEGKREVNWHVLRLCVRPWAWLLSLNCELTRFFPAALMDLIQSTILQYTLPIEIQCHLSRAYRIGEHVQYQESSLNVIQRLLAERGIIYYFDQKNWVFIDALAQFPATILKLSDYTQHHNSNGTHLSGVSNADNIAVGNRIIDHTFIITAIQHRAEDYSNLPSRQRIANCVRPPQLITAFYATNALFSQCTPPKPIIVTGLDIGLHKNTQQIGFPWENQRVTTPSFLRWHGWTLPAMPAQASWVGYALGDPNQPICLRSVNFTAQQPAGWQQNHTGFHFINQHNPTITLTSQGNFIETIKQNSRNQQQQRTEKIRQGGQHIHIQHGSYRLTAKHITLAVGTTKMQLTPDGITLSAKRIHLDSPHNQQTGSIILAQDIHHCATGSGALQSKAQSIQINHKSPVRAQDLLSCSTGQQRMVDVQTGVFAQGHPIATTQSTTSCMGKPVSSTSQVQLMNSSIAPVVANNNLQNHNYLTIEFGVIDGGQTTALPYSACQLTGIAGNSSASIQANQAVFYQLTPNDLNQPFQIYLQ